MAKNISAHYKKKIDLIEKKLMPFLESVTPNYHKTGLKSNAENRI